MKFLKTYVLDKGRVFTTLFCAALCFVGWPFMVLFGIVMVAHVITTLIDMR